eukprot:749311-Ditylum_brightwellii.AAC.1
MSSNTKTDNASNNSDTSQNDNEKNPRHKEESDEEKEREPVPSQQPEQPQHWLDMSVYNEDSDNKTQSKKWAWKKKSKKSIAKKGTTQQQNNVAMQASQEVRQHNERFVSGRENKKAIKIPKQN